MMFFGAFRALGRRSGLRGGAVARMVAAGLSVVLTGCGATISTRIVADRLPPVRRAELVRTLGDPVRDRALAAQRLVAWAGDDAGRLVVASGLVLRLKNDVGFELLAAQLAWRGLVATGVPSRDWMTDSAARDALSAYNVALAAFLDDWSAPLARGENGVVTTPVGPLDVRVRYDVDPPVRAGYFDRMVVSESLAIRGFRQRTLVDGLGVAMVGRRLHQPGREAEMAHHPERGIAMALSCRADFHGSGVVLDVVDPLDTEAVRLRGGAVPVAADFTAPLAITAGGVNDLLLGLRNLLDVATGAASAGVYMVGPADPDRIPVLLIHGLSSTPIVWRNVVSAALADPDVRRNFQFWYAFYATGAPTLVSAATIRQDVVDLRAQPVVRGSRASREIDLVGYSMGGNVARILATDIGDRLWNQLATRPIDQVNFSPADRAAVQQIAFFKPLSGVRVVIFIATPHRGARLADASFAHLGARLVRLPVDFLDMQSSIFGAIGEALKPGTSPPARLTGIDNLSPSSPLYQAWEGLPMEKGITFFSIMGDRGRGDTPNSSDGIVGYWSSHLAGAERELIVPTGHDAQAYPGTEQEILRILRRQSRDRITGR